MLLDKIKLEDDEEVIIQTRRHWFVIVGQLVGMIVAIIAPPIIWLLVDLESIPAFENLDLALAGPVFTFTYGLWFIFMWIGVFSIWTNYYLDILTLTDRRVILVNQKGFFRRNVASFRLERLQDMNIEINGFLATMLDFGNINVETAGHSEEEFKATGLPKPRDIKAAILKASDQRLQESNYPAANNSL